MKVTGGVIKITWWLSSREVLKGSWKGKWNPNRLADKAALYNGDNRKHRVTSIGNISSEQFPQCKPYLGKGSALYMELGRVDYLVDSVINWNPLHHYIMSAYQLEKIGMWLYWLKYSIFLCWCNFMPLIINLVMNNWSFMKHLASLVQA